MKSILYVVDNNPTVGRFLFDYFHKDFEIKLFKSGIEALYAVYNKNRPSLILLNQELPGVSGLQILENLYSSSDYKTIPTIVLSNSRCNKVRNACLMAGAIDFLAKPFNPSELKRRIQKAINLTCF